MHKVLFTLSTFSSEQIDELRKDGLEIIAAKGDLSEDELIDALRGVAGYILGGDEIATKKVIDSADNLKVIAFLGAGYEKYIDVAATKEKGVFVTNTPGANLEAVAEHTVALILDAVKKITFVNDATKQGVWEKYKTWNLEGKTVGIIGMGHVGSKVAEIMATGFGMRTLYFSRSTKTDVEKNLKAKKVSLETLLKESDVISIHTSLNPETTKLIGAKQLDLVKPTAVLINCARAEIVDGKALYQALSVKKLATAAFDTYYQEPLPKLEEDDYKLLTLDDSKFIITSHNAYNSVDAVRAMETMVLESLKDVFAGKTPINEVKK